MDNHVDCINYVFKMLESAYPQQFNKAFNNKDKMRNSKNLWYKSLKDIPIYLIIDAVNDLIKHNDFILSIKKVRDFSIAKLNKIPCCRTAFYEAANAPSPVQCYKWSHPIVYEAAKEVGLFFLRNQQENISYPIFKEVYQRLSLEMAGGKKFLLNKMDDEKEKNKIENNETDKDYGREMLRKIREEHGI